MRVGLIAAQTRRIPAIFTRSQAPPRQFVAESSICVESLPPSVIVGGENRSACRKPFTCGAGRRYFWASIPVFYLATRTAHPITIQGCAILDEEPQPRRAKLKKPTKHMSDTRSKPTQHEIEVCAYCTWEQEGRPAGRALNHWLQAELQLVVESIWNGEATEQDRKSPQTAKTSSNACPPNRTSDFCGLP